MTVYKEPSSENPFDRQVRVAEAITHDLKCHLLGLPDGTPLEQITGLLRYKYDSLPLNLQPESRFKKFVLLTKKKYMALVVDRNGNITEVKKGTVEVKRDNCSLLKMVYKDTKDEIFRGSALYDVQNIIIDHVIKLVTRRVASRDLVIYKAIGKFEKYAKKEEGTDKKILSKKYDENGYIVPGQPGMVSSSDDPLDWFYSNPQSHVHLALKMLERGDRVPPNTRMEYVFTRQVGELPDADATQRDKIEDYTYFVEHSDEVVIDVPYYILHQLAKPISQLLRLGWPNKVTHRPIVHATDEAVNDALSQLPHEIRNILGRKKGIRVKVLCFLNSIPQWREKCTILVGAPPNQKGRVLNEFTRCVDLCNRWYISEKMNRYYFNFGVNKIQRNRKKDKLVEPFMMDLMQTVTRHHLVVDELKRGFEAAYFVDD